MKTSTLAKSGPVSVVIPCFNCANTIRRAIDSVLQQSLRPAEVVLVDDGNPDDTRTVLGDVAKALVASAVPAKIVTLAENHGAGHARNVGWDVATSTFVAFLDSDDAWHPRKLEIQLAAMLSTDAAVVGHGSLRDQRGCVQWHAATPDSSTVSRISRRRILLANRFSTPSVMLRRDLPYRFPPQRFSEDYGLWLALVLDGNPVYLLDQPLVAEFKRPYGDSGLSSNLVQMELGELTNFRRLFTEGRLSAFEFLFFSGFSMLKFLRRVLLVALRRTRVDR